MVSFERCPACGIDLKGAGRQAVVDHVKLFHPNYVVQRTMFSGGSVGVVFSGVESEVKDLAWTVVDVVAHVDFGGVLDWVIDVEEVVRYATENLVYSLGLLGLGFVFLLFMVAVARRRDG